MDLRINTANAKVQIKMASNDINPNKCSQCEYTSSHTGHLRTHLKMHSVYKLKRCNICNYASYLTGNLRAHLKIHSGEKSNKCNQCDFASSYATWVLKAPKPQQKKANKLLKGIPLDCSVNSENVGV